MMDAQLAKHSDWGLGSAEPSISEEECPRCRKPLEPNLKGKTEPEEVRFCSFCRMPLLNVAGKYRLLRDIGEGGGGIVYLAVHMHLQLNPYRVVKFLRSEHLQNPDGLKRFSREIEVTAALSQKNEHIVRIYDDFGLVPKLGHFYVMEYLTGMSLREKIERHPQGLPLHEALHIFHQLCQAMGTIHQGGIVHRDLKPQNIFLIERDEDPMFVKVMDFGVARVLKQTSLTQTKGASIGTPLYMSPEQCMGLPADERSDIYAMGILLYELLAGRPPFVGALGEGTISLLEIASAHLYQMPFPFRSFHPDSPVPSNIEEVVMKALSKSREERFQTVQAFEEAMESAYISAIEKGWVSIPPVTSREGLVTTRSAALISASLSASRRILPTSDGNPQHSRSPFEFTTSPTKKAFFRRPSGILLLVCLFLCVIGSAFFFLGPEPTETMPSTPNPKRTHQINTSPPIQRAAQGPQPVVRAIVAPRRDVEPAQPSVTTSPSRTTKPKKRPPLRTSPEVVYFKSPPRRGHTKGCSLDPSRGRWVLFVVSPPNAIIETTQRSERRRSGFCVLQEDRQSTRLRITHPLYQPCSFERRLTKRTFRLRLKRTVNDQLQQFDDSIDYCIK